MFYILIVLNNSKRNCTSTYVGTRIHKKITTENSSDAYNIKTTLYTYWDKPRDKGEFSKSSTGKKLFWGWKNKFIREN